jgi:hypothetical protein
METLSEKKKQKSHGKPIIMQHGIMIEMMDAMQ